MPRQVLDLYTTEEAYERIEHSLLTGSELRNIGTDRPGEVGYMPSDPANYNEATTQVTRTRDTRLLLELFSISQVAQWIGGLQSKRWWPSQR